ncbi:MAG TPA: DnaJ domain-containing protein [Vicinamibacterales bacterium]|nr:DnaJ domain-containing protein [Vicinamibacterales bacterium]
MSDDTGVDYYEVLQVSANADPDTVHRVYRFLAQRFHPDNQETGSEARFREIHQAYTVLSDPEQRARYDISYQQRRRDRWRLVTTGASAENDFELEHMVRLTLLEALYTKRRTEPSTPAMFSGDLEGLIGRPREQLDFTIWYLVQKKYITRDDNSRLQITADGVEFLEKNYSAKLQRRRLTAQAGVS